MVNVPKKQQLENQHEKTTEPALVLSGKHPLHK